MMGTTVKIGKSKYVFTDEHEMIDIMNKVLDYFKNKENNVEQPTQQSVLKRK